MTKSKKTSFDSYLDEQLEDPDFVTAYNQAKQELKEETILVNAMAELLGKEINLSYRDLISIHIDGDSFIVEYESYFNPHAKPYSLEDKKVFDNASDAAKFFCSYIKERNQD
jgi:hypothetical protein